MILKSASANRVRDALYEDVVTNMTMANRYSEYMTNGLESDPEDFLDPSAQPKSAFNGSS